MNFDGDVFEVNNAASNSLFKRSKTILVQQDDNHRSFDCSVIFKHISLGDSVLPSSAEIKAQQFILVLQCKSAFEASSLSCLFF